MTKIIVYVSGGCVQDIVADTDENLEVYLQDKDNWPDGEIEEFPPAIVLDIKERLSKNLKIFPFDEEEELW